MKEIEEYRSDAMCRVDRIQEMRIRTIFLLKVTNINVIRAAKIVLQFRKV